MNDFLMHGAIFVAGLSSVGLTWCRYESAPWLAFAALLAFSLSFLVSGGVTASLVKLTQRRKL